MYGTGIKWGHACNFTAQCDKREPTVALLWKKGKPAECCAGEKVEWGLLLAQGWATVCREKALSSRGQWQRRAAFPAPLTVTLSPPRGSTNWPRQEQLLELVPERRSLPCPEGTENEEGNHGFLQQTQRDYCVWLFYLSEVYLFMCIYFSKLVF